MQKCLYPAIEQQMVLHHKIFYQHEVEQMQHFFFNIKKKNKKKEKWKNGWNTNVSRINASIG